MTAKKKFIKQKRLVARMPEDVANRLSAALGWQGKTYQSWVRDMANKEIEKFLKTAKSIG